MKKFDITVCLDRSGSMQKGKDDFIGGLRSFINDQKGDDPTDFTLVQFDSENNFELVFDGVDINLVDIDKVNLVPRGRTPLLDAVGKTIAHIENRIKNQTDIQPILFIISDGGENSSKEWSKPQVKNAIQEKKDWKIMFLGADIDAFAEAGYIGINNMAAINVVKTAAGIAGTYRAMSGSISRMKEVYTCGGITADALLAANYTDEERAICIDTKS